MTWQRRADMTWHTPSKEGLEWAADLAARYIRKPLAVLQRYATAISSVTPVSPANKMHDDTMDGASLSGATQTTTAINGHSVAGHSSVQGDVQGDTVSAHNTSSAEASGNASDAVRRANGHVDVDGDGGMAVDAENSSPSTRARIHKEREAGLGGGGKRTLDIQVQVPNRSSDAAGVRCFGMSTTRRKREGGVTSTEARLAVLQVRYVLEGLVAAMPACDVTPDGAGGDDDMAVDDDDDQGIPLDNDFAGDEVYTSGTYELPQPIPNVDTSRALDMGKAEDGSELSLSRVALVIRELARVALTQHSQDSKMLKALTKCLDVCMNGVDILQVCAAVCCSVSQCVVSQCVAVCCSVSA